MSLLGVGVCCRLCGLFGIGAVVGILAGLSLSVMACWRVCMRISWFVFVRCWGCLVCLCRCWRVGSQLLCELAAVVSIVTVAVIVVFKELVVVAEAGQHKSPLVGLACRTSAHVAGSRGCCLHYICVQLRPFPAFNVISIHAMCVRLKRLCASAMAQSGKTPTPMSLCASS